ncbi:MAG: hypothetical protein EKK39_14560 [Sphingobacteriales bacterium]|uniref:hypothetical protein n=1 Tax=Hydrotalea flava TaxID=714549 RepID=UPI000FBA0932|nr:hypothetical protein [Hydrotalea flava]RTL47304.1 MAG: hypothetical protein EKK39_14560 [Sphingobacteriales bacterium]
MKTFTLLLFTLLTINIYSQKKEFIRVYNIEGRKIIHGRDYEITDTTIEFKNKHTIIPYTEIGFIRTKHSFGHNIGVGSILGIAALGIFSFASNVQSDLFDKGTTVVLFSTLVGAPSGAFVGAIYNGLKKTRRFNINGDFEKWQKFNASFLKKSK